MPDWQPNWEDVQFDYTAADEAVAACRSAATLIEASLNVEVGRLPKVTQDWSGPAREDFNSGSQQIRTLRGQVHEDLLRLIRDLKAAADYARTEQATRVADRERWRQEAQAERRQRPGPGMN